MFHSNRLYIEGHNSAMRNYSLALNRFADLSQVPFLTCSNSACAPETFTTRKVLS